MKRCHIFIALIALYAVATIHTNPIHFSADELFNNSATIFTFQEPWEIVGYERRGECKMCLVFLKDNAQCKFILKCYDDNQKEEAICEYIGSFIGASVGVPINKVQIITESSLFAEINNGTSLATLHTYVPGKELCKWYESPADDIVLKGGLVSERHLETIAFSDDLCDIITLDIFLNNKDRHYENCFFDDVTLRYYAIDMGDIFLAVQKFPNIESDISVATSEMLSAAISQENLLALNAYNFLKNVTLADLSVEHVRALRRVGNTLQTLLSLYPAEIIFTLLMIKAQLINYTYTDYKKMYLRMFLEHNMYWTQKIVEVINENF